MSLYESVILFGEQFLQLEEIPVKEESYESSASIVPSARGGYIAPRE